MDGSKRLVASTRTRSEEIGSSAIAAASPSKIRCDEMIDENLPFWWLVFWFSDWDSKNDHICLLVYWHLYFYKYNIYIIIYIYIFLLATPFNWSLGTTNSQVDGFIVLPPSQLPGSRGHQKQQWPRSAAFRRRGPTQEFPAGHRHFFGNHRAIVIYSLRIFSSFWDYLY